MNNKTSLLSLPRNHLIMDLILLFGGFITILNSSLIAPALPSIMHELSVDATEGQWLTTVFLLVNGIMIPISAFLLGKFTTRHLFFAAMGIFTLGTLFCGLAETFPVLLGGRILQAMGAGVLMPMMQTIIMLTLPRNLRGIGMGMVGLVIACAPAVGPVLAGFLVDVSSWRSMFYAMLPLAFLIILLACFHLENMGETTDEKLDIPSVILSTAGFGGLLYAFSVVGSSGMSAAVIVTFLIGAVALYFFFRRQLHMEHPMLKVDILKNKQFTVSVVLVMFVNASLMIGGILNPIYIQDLRGYSATLSGLIMFPAAVVSALVSPLSGHWFDKYGPRVLAIPGFLMVAIFTIPLSTMTPTTSLVFLTISYTLRMVGLTMVNMPITTWGMNALDNKDIPHGTAIANTARQMAGSLGTAILVTVMTVTVSSASNPESVLAQIHGINMGFAGVIVYNLTAAFIAFHYVKKGRK